MPTLSGPVYGNAEWQLRICRLILGVTPVFERLHELRVSVNHRDYKQFLTDISPALSIELIIELNVNTTIEIFCLTMTDFDDLCDMIDRNRHAGISEEVFNRCRNDDLRRYCEDMVVTDVEPSLEGGLFLYMQKHPDLVPETIPDECSSSIDLLITHFMKRCGEIRSDLGLTDS